MKALPIRIRLSLRYFAMFASAAALLSVASVWMLHRSVDETEYHELQERADDVQAILQHQDPGQTMEALQGDFAAIYNLKDDGKWLQIRDEDGNWLFRSKRMIAANPIFPAADQLPPLGTLAEFRQGEHSVRVLAYPIVARGRRYSVETGIALDKSMALLATFQSGLLLLTPMVILLAALGGHWMSRTALEPVAALAAQARLINDRNLHMRLPVPDADDEVSDLSRTLNQMLERIDKAFASVRAFTGNASHELRTPISLLRTEIEVTLLRPRDGGEYRDALLRLHQEAVRMTGLVENLLSLARADGGAEAMSRAPIAVSGLLKRAERAWVAAMNRAMLDFRVEMPREDLVLLGDPNGVQRVLAILLENAAKYTPPGGSVVLSAKAEQAHVVLSVRDTGIGISADDIPHIFDRFYRGAQASDPVPRGSGLGLALAWWIAERHGTELSVESEPGRGSTFTWPLEKAGATAPMGQESNRTIGSPSS
jgi:heavy metal sensor kinase